jgi:hypothetical protein
MTSFISEPLRKIVAVATFCFAITGFVMHRAMSGRHRPIRAHSRDVAEAVKHPF